VVPHEHLLAVFEDPHELPLLIVCGMVGDGALKVSTFRGGCFEHEGAKLVDFAIDEEEATE
jgi:hypothetical protein